MASTLLAGVWLGALPELHSACYARQEPLEVFRFAKDDRGRLAMKPFVLGAEGGGHGIAFGDVNGDGREDVLCEIGWYERPHLGAQRR